MTMASFRVSLAWDGKRPGRWSKLVAVDTRNEAVLCAQQWLVWSHETGRPRALHRYVRYTVEERYGAEWVMVREGNRKDATEEYREENTAFPALGAVQHVPFKGRKEGFTPRKHQAPRRDRGTSRLSSLISKVLNDI
jgi:hypothetical protein